LHRNAAEAVLFAVRVCRALLGDDMGLGKTIQAIAATEMLARHFGVSKVLVICPTSLKYQWQSERRQGENAARVINGGRRGVRRTTPWTTSARSQTTRNSRPISI
jgi:SNF2 family DNA or RNA helicase